MKKDYPHFFCVEARDPVYNINQSYDTLKIINKNIRWDEHGVWGGYKT